MQSEKEVGEDFFFSQAATKYVSTGTQLRFYVNRMKHRCTELKGDCWMLEQTFRVKEEINGLYWSKTWHYA